MCLNVCVATVYGTFFNSWKFKNSEYYSSKEYVITKIRAKALSHLYDGNT